MSINWQLGLMPDIGQNALAAFDKGRERRREDDYRQAVNVYAQQPTEQNLNALLPFASPDQTFKIAEQRQKMQAERRTGLDKAMGQAALDIMSRPEAERPAVWDAYARQFASIDPSSAQSVGQYNEQAVMAILAQQGLMKDFQAAAAPKYQVIPEGGTLVNTRDPSAVSQFSPQGQAQQTVQGQPGQVENKHMVVGQAAQLARELGPQKFIEWQQRNNIPVLVNSPEEASALPPGALMVSPDGRIGVKR